MAFSPSMLCCFLCDFCKGREGAFWKMLHTNRLLIFTITGIVLGIAVGLINNYFWETTDLQKYYWGFLGDVIMMNMLKCIIVPLIIFSITTGIASMAENSSQLSVYAIAYYLTTTVIAIILGIVMSLIIKPGSRISSADQTALSGLYSNETREGNSVADGLLDIIRNTFPKNIIESTFSKHATYRTSDDPSTATIAMKNFYDEGKVGDANVLGLIMFFSVFGYYLGKLARKGNKSVQQCLLLLNGFNDAIMCMIDVIMWYVPIGLFFLISKRIMAMGTDAGAIWKALGFFSLTSILCLLIHGFIFLPLIYFAVTRKNPFTYMAGVSQAMITAFSNASSAATMPITIRCCENNNKIDSRITRFMLPLGATINMDGTALYEAVACFFIAYLNDVSLNFGQIVTIGVTATAASVGAAAVPSAGLIMLIMVMNSVGLGAFTGDIGLIYTIDWFLDRIRTAINVWGDCVGCGVVAHLGRDALEGTKNEFVSEKNDNLAFEA